MSLLIFSKNNFPSDDYPQSVLWKPILFLDIHIYRSYIYMPLPPLANRLFTNWQGNQMIWVMMLTIGIMSSLLSLKGCKKRGALNCVRQQCHRRMV